MRVYLVKGNWLYFSYDLPKILVLLTVLDAILIKLIFEPSNIDSSGIAIISSSFFLKI